MLKARIIITIITLAFVAGVGWAVSLLARGYRFDSETLSVRPSGLFVAKSVPDGAQLIIDGELKSATNDTIYLNPDTYQVEVKKEGYLTWKKQLTIKKEEVTNVDVYLFPQAPSLTALTFTGAEKPLLSPDRTKIVYTVNSKEQEEKTGVWVMDLVDLPVGFSKDPRMIADLKPDNLTLAWSPNSRSLLATAETTDKNVYLLEAGQTVKSTALTALTPAQIQTLQQDWEKEAEHKKKNTLSKLPEKMAEVILESKEYLLSPDETKILYTAEKDINLENTLITPIPGSSTQKQERSIKVGKTYIYDIKEDRNFLIFEGEVILGNTKRPEPVTESAEETPIKQKTKPTPIPKKELKTSIHWFPTSNHTVIAEEEKITILDYDGTNKQAVWTAPYDAPFAIPFPNPSRLLILTNLGSDQIPNLYSLSLR